ncbi:transglycosylase domain-containing protein [Catenovulum sp. SX2]|uniref:transglycosylase domain-containing protein n=1 Tax=Catenovulum sp. SX2 TaxID=3398614 RepID=UPI003F8456CC
MKVLRNTILILVTIILLVPLGTISYFYFDEFRPKQKFIQLIIDGAGREDANPPHTVTYFIEVSHTEIFGQSTWTKWVARQLSVKLNLNHRKTITRHISQVSWWLLLNIKHSKKELFTIYCSLANQWNNESLNELSLRLINKPLSKLSEGEAAKIIAYLYAPSYFSKYPEKLEARAKALLGKKKT